MFLRPWNLNLLLYKVKSNQCKLVTILTLLKAKIWNCTYFCLLTIHKPDIWEEKCREMFHCYAMWAWLMFLYGFVLPAKCVFSGDITMFYTVFLECVCWKTKLTFQDADGDGNIAFLYETRKSWSFITR